jgi:hypothetical protein
MSVASLGPVLDALRRNYSDREFETWNSATHGWVDSLSQKLPGLSAFSLVDQVGVRTYRGDDADDRRLEALWYACDTPKCRAGGILWTALAETAPSKRRARDSRYDISFLVGYGSDGYYTALSISSDSPLWADAHLRSDLFRRTIRLLGLEGQIDIEVHGEDYFLKAQPPLRLRFRHVRPDNVNPTELDIVGFASRQEAIERMRAAKSGLGMQILEGSFACTLSREQYELTRGQLNELNCGWHLDILGTLDQNAEGVLNGREPVMEALSWIPAFRWWEEDTCAKVYGSVIIENGQRYLEIATDGGTLEMPQERVAFLEGLRFTPVFP